MRFEERVVTPEEAQRWLDAKDGNRPISNRVVLDYARQMKEGWWQDNPQCISFNTHGKLIDGQHRLSAIVLINMPIKMNIIWDAPPQSFHILDRGLPRSVSFITKVPTFGTQCYTLLLSVVQTHQKPAPNDILLMHELLKSYIQSLHEASASKLKFFASAPIRSAALVSLAQGGQSDYILKTYALLSRAASTNEDMPKVGNAFIEAYNQGKLVQRHESAGWMLRKELYIRARYVFDVRNAEIDKMPIPFGESQRADYMMEVRNIVQRALGKHIAVVDFTIRKAQSGIQKAVHPEPVNTKLTKQLARVLDAEQIRLSQMARD